MELNLPHRTLTKPPSTILDLSNELIILVFEQVLLWDLDLDSDPLNAWLSAPDKVLPVLRLVCKRFNRLATPIRYRHLTIQTHHQIRGRRPQSRRVRKAVAEAIKCFTEHATVVDKINWHHVVRNHASLPRLKTISWRFHAHDAGWLSRNFYPIPPSILRPGVKISIDGTGYYHDFISLIPPEHVFALHLGYWHPAPPHQMNANDAYDLEYNPRFKNYILQAKNLECLDYDLAKVPEYYGGAAPDFPAFLPDERMPRFKRLVLTGYRWLYTREEVKSSWDFSKLEDLDITGLNNNAFFRTVDAKWFSSLCTLKLGTFLCWSPGQHGRLKKQILLHTFLRNMPQLEHLSMNTYTEDFPLDVLMAMENLRSLEFTEDITLGGKALSPRLNMQDLEELLQYLPHLKRLHIDFETWSGDFKRILFDMISQFPALRYIDINNHGYNTDPSDDLDSLVGLESEPSAKLISLHYGQYVDSLVDPWYYCGNTRWERYTSTRWIIPGNAQTVL
ncbi:hypothetical protein ONS95_002808 [Cadophora gregata]|uniref:uncharacterized protein n=1 Tax=Cadophora gregata TaxID=51156 RepID=UPI0026DB13AB|nr:uncharacterized protein ONS95_002808 [Cadophora gregata]KAK0110156.1 hypothetical protein ONS95_002808 [Cadophora gregata]KAK0110229.1 hypothetical protein ONS96_001851 [Cadophora gregata f. sp. sojae]